MCGFKSFDEIVRFAIQREQDAVNGYGSMAEKTNNPALKRLLFELRDEEVNHKRLLEGSIIKVLEEHEIKQIPDLKISDFLVSEPLSKDISIQDLLIYAAKTEQKAVELYSVLKQCVERPEFVKLFEFLIEQEKLHKLKLETEYDQNIYQED